ncbi:MAG: cadmium-translocating P-type ATPase [Phycisphaerae bacterium]|jgi:P-type Cu+ transporter|nr:cadmium-translocating P-type ATPase [Phycisphaerae bacterium]MBT6282128.1 cadmium-translocating P-type ATPase [Phycisphaerae bacterium]
MDTIELKVDELNCAACSSAVEKALNSVDGVVSSSVSVATGRATITGNNLNGELLVKIATDAGYPSEVIDEGIDPAKLATEIETRQNKNASDWKRRAILGVSIWAPFEALHWSAGFLGIEGPWVPWVMFLASTTSMILVGGGFFSSAIGAAKRFKTNMDTLITIGASSAYFFSLFIFISEKIFGYDLGYPMYFMEAAALLAIISIGHWLEATSTAKAGSAIRELLKMQPDTAEVVAEDGSTTKIVTGEVGEGMRLLVRPGSRIPVDGLVVDGMSEVDESIVTGEPLPRAKNIGDTLIAGSMNTTGQLILKTTVDGRHTTISRIAQLVTSAQSSKAGIQRIADKVSAIFVPIVLVIAVITVIAWVIAGDIETGFVSAVTILVISCPCALGLATPMAVMVAAGESSLRGILVKDASSLELAGKIVTVIFDKTGTLTQGKPVVATIESENQFSEEEILKYAASVETPSEHPIATAIVKEASNRNITVPSVSNFEATAGIGVHGIVDGKSVAVLRDNAATCKIELDGKVIGRITVTDAIRKEAKSTIAELQASGIDVHMLSGDRKETALSVAKEVGIKPENVHAEASPSDKTDIIASLLRPSMMVGDGINDAAALAASDVGVAIASGTNVAMESAAIIIPANTIEATAESIHIAKDALTTIKQNLVFAFMYNVAAIPLAAFGVLGQNGPLIAAAAMGFSDITVIGNAIRLKHKLRKRRIKTQ